MDRFRNAPARFSFCLYVSLQVTLFSRFQIPRPLQQSLQSIQIGLNSSKSQVRPQEYLMSTSLTHKGRSSNRPLQECYTRDERFCLLTRFLVLIHLIPSRFPRW
jgi:hypothetical protein